MNAFRNYLRRGPEIIVTRSVCAVMFWCLANFAQAQTLPLPESLIDLRSEQGEQLLRDSDALESFVPLSVNFITIKPSAA